MALSTTALARLNELDDSELDAELVEICSSPTWARLVRSSRPWADAETVHAANAEAMAGLDQADLDAAIAGHARIGQPRAGDATSHREQAGVHDAGDKVLDELAQANADYEAKFGHLFLICATGRTADMMLDALRERYGNDAGTERETVRAELRKINDIRIDGLLEEA